MLEAVEQSLRLIARATKPFTILRAEGREQERHSNASPGSRTHDRTDNDAGLTDSAHNQTTDEAADSHRRGAQDSAHYDSRGDIVLSFFGKRQLEADVAPILLERAHCQIGLLRARQMKAAGRAAERASNAGECIVGGLEVGVGPLAPADLEVLPRDEIILEPAICDLWIAWYRAHDRDGSGAKVLVEKARLGGCRGLLVQGLANVTGGESELAGDADQLFLTDLVVGVRADARELDRATDDPLETRAGDAAGAWFRRSRCIFCHQLLLLRLQRELGLLLHGSELRLGGRWRQHRLLMLRLDLGLALRAHRVRRALHERTEELHGQREQRR